MKVIGVLLNGLFKRQRASSMNDFIHRVLKERCTEVEVTPMHKNSGLIGFPGFSFGASSLLHANDAIHEEYYLSYIAFLPSGGRITYEGERTQRCSTLDVAKDDHEKEALRIFLAAEKSARALRAALATVHVDVVFESGMPVGAATRRELYARAGEYGLL